MKVKFSRGPKNGHRAVAPDTGTYRYLVQEPKAPNYAFYPYNPETKIEFRQGEYQKSHRRLKDGTVIFEWMGWLDGEQ